MKGKADTNDGWGKVAADLMEAFARAEISNTQHAICWWVIRRTYGVRLRSNGGELQPLKTTPCSIRGMATDLGMDRKNVRKASAELVDLGILMRTAEGEIGINTLVSGWPLRGQEFKALSKDGVDSPMGKGSATPGGGVDSP